VARSIPTLREAVELLPDPARAATVVQRGARTLQRAGRTVGQQAVEQVRGANQPYATPPPGSGLKPVLGEPGLPVVGTSLKYISDPLRYAREGYEQYGPVSWSRAFGARMITVLGPEGTEQVLLNRDRAFANGPGWEYFIGPFFERGLMLLDFEEHLHHRRIMQQAFTRDRLVTYLKGMNAVLGDGMDAWDDGPAFGFHPAFKQLTLDLATTVFVGHHLGPEADALNRAFFDTVQAGTAIVRAPVPGGRWRKGLEGRKVLEDFFRAELPAKRDGNGDDLFTALCHAADEDGNTFSDTDVVNHMIFLLMAAHDTSTTTMTTLVYELARQPDWQDRLREESRVLGTDHLEHDDLERLPSHAMAIKEAQRILAPVPSMARYAVKDTQVLGHYIPAGSRVGLYPHFNHLMEEYWPNPHHFDPERFSPERAEHKVHPFAWAPFGGGVHKCIGMHFGNLEVTAALHHMLLRFRWSVPDGYRMPVSMVSLPYPEDGLPITLERIAR
jgi:cytochrome P450